MVHSLVIFTEVKDTPSVHMSLPGTLFVGSKLRLRFTLRRRNGPRTEELRVEGEYRITEASVDATKALPKQLLRVEALGVAPVWRAVRNPSALQRMLPPTHSKATVDE